MNHCGLDLQLLATNRPFLSLETRNVTYYIQNTKHHPHHEFSMEIEHICLAISDVGRSFMFSLYLLQDNNVENTVCSISTKKQKPIYEICYDCTKQIKSNYHVNDCGQLETHSVVIQCLNGSKNITLPF